MKRAEIKKERKRKSGKLFFLVGIFALSVSLITAVCWETFFDIMMEKQLRLNPSSVMFKMWEKNPLPIYMKIYLFNFTNSDFFMLNKSVIPNFEEVGPFLFEEIREKVYITWDDTKDTVTFNQSRKWLFLPDESKNLSLEIRNLNPIASTMAYMSRLWESNLQRQIANTLIKRHEPFLVKATAREWLFDGIPDKFLELFETLRAVADIPIPYDKFGWFYERNGSTSFDGVFTMKRGRKDPRAAGMLVTWNNMTRTEHYEDLCGLVYGSTGEVIPPLRPLQSSLSVFASDICSYISLKYSGLADVEGIQGYEYVGDKSVFDNGTSYSENACFNHGEPCLSGLRNVSSCRFGSPAFISFPHFYLADPNYTEKMMGMNSKENEHKFRLIVEPKTGIPLAVDGSFQINFLIKPYEWCEEFNGVPKIFVPMLWFKQTVKMSPRYAVVLRVILFMRKNGSCFFYAFSALILTVFYIFYIKHKREV